MNLYRVVTIMTTEYLVKAVDQEEAELAIRHPDTASGLLELTEITSLWSEPVRVVGKEFSA